MRDTNCPNCGAPVYPDERKCPYCDTPYKEMGEIARAYDTSGKVVFELHGVPCFGFNVDRFSPEQIERALQINKES